MKGTGWACRLLLLTMAAVSSGRNASEYFQQAGFQHTPSRPEDAFVFFTTGAPPLVCEAEQEDGWPGADASEADLRLIVPRYGSHFICSFEGNATTLANLYMLQASVPGVFVSKRERTVGLLLNEIDKYCSVESQLPDLYFHLRVQRPHEEKPVKCRLHCKGVALYLQFPGFPTIVCEIFGSDKTPFHIFNLPGIADQPFKCAFRVYSELILGDTQTEEHLSSTLLNKLPGREDGVQPRVLCSSHATSNGTVNFKLRFQGSAIYNCGYYST